jgi:signal transduction histidine kinase
MGLLTITYLLVDRSTGTEVLVSNKAGAIAIKGATAGGPQNLTPQLGTGSPTAQQLRLARQLRTQAAAQHANDLHQLVTQSAIALAITAVLTIVLGWLMAGRVLRPLRNMTTTTHQISARNLHERLALTGPDDEVKDLADTIDGLLARLETAFDAQRQFAANVSHELRTPLTLDRSLLEVALADSDASIADLRTTLEELLASGEQQERLIEALLTLARSEQGLDRWDPIDLTAITRRVMTTHHQEAEQRELYLHVVLDEASTSGNPYLVERAITNLVDNAIRHNAHGGHVDISTRTTDGQAILTVSNSGAHVAEDVGGRLFRPFQRLEGDRTHHADGHGLGLSIVRAIAIAHDAGIKVRLPSSGGLHVEIHFPLAPVHTNGHYEGPSQGELAKRRLRSSTRRQNQCCQPRG